MAALSQENRVDNPMPGRFRSQDSQGVCPYGRDIDRQQEKRVETSRQGTDARPHGGKHALRKQRVFNRYSPETHGELGGLVPAVTGHHHYLPCTGILKGGHNPSQGRDAVQGGDGLEKTHAAGVAGR
jgi:hypothetical protein